MKTKNERLLEAISDDRRDGLYEFARNDVLFESFERDEIDYYIGDGVRYEQSVVMPSKFEDKMWYYVTQRPAGHNVRVGSNYHDIGVDVDEDRMNDRPLGSADPKPVVILFRSELLIGSNGHALDSDVYIAERPGEDD